ncbi:MAG: BrnA antitoxin family protein [Deltaproteobacteria bacterium]|nr:BrnA antitoxin family protein [Deltaproteobacteria bacterium]
MRKNYDFSSSKKNPYLKHLKKQITIRLDFDTIEYFRKLSEETGIAYQILINLYLKECVKKEKRPDVTWA